MFVMKIVFAMLCVVLSFTLFCVAIYFQKCIVDKKNRTAARNSKLRRKEIMSVIHMVTANTVSDKNANKQEYHEFINLVYGETMKLIAKKTTQWLNDTYNDPQILVKQLIDFHISRTLMHAKQDIEFQNQNNELRNMLSQLFSHDTQNDEDE